MRILTVYSLLNMTLFVDLAQGCCRGGSRGGVLGVRTPPPFGGPPNFIKREKTSRACAGIHCILVLNSYPDPPFRNPVSAPVLAIDRIRKDLLGFNLSNIFTLGDCRHPLNMVFFSYFIIG